MAFAEKYFIQHKTQVRGSTTTTTTTRIELHQDGFVGSATELDGRGNFWTHEYENLDPVKIFEEPVQKSRLEMHINISDATEKAILTDIFAADDDDYRLVKKVNGTVVWTGAVLTDLLEYPEGGYPFEGTIIAKDLSSIEGDYYTSTGAIDGALKSGYETIITTIAELLSYTGYGLNIHTYTSWKENNMTDSTDDFLNEVTNDVYALRTYARTGDESDEPITVFEALKQICRNHGLILRQANGAWRLYHRSALGTPTAVDEYIYNSSGTQTAKNTGASQVDISVSADRIVRYVLPNSRNRFNKGLKGVRTKYDHRTQVTTIQFPNVVELDGTTTSQEFSQLFISDGNQQIKLSAEATAEFNDTITSANILYEMRIVAGATTYWYDADPSVRSWGTSFVSNSVDMTDTYATGGKIGFSASINVTSTDVPAAADGTLYVELYVARSGGTFADFTDYTNLKVSINNSIAQENSKYIDYELVQSGAYSGQLDYSDVWYGDGPTGYSRGALKVGSTFTTDTWYRKGEVTLINQANILLREILDNQRVTTRNLRADLYGSYIADKVLTYNSGNFFFLGGQQTGTQNRWDADFLELNIQTGSDTFRDLPKYAEDGQTGTASTSSSSSGVSLTEGDARYFKQTSLLGEIATADQNTAIGNLGITATKTELNYVDGVTSNIQTQLDAKQPLDSELTTLSGMTSAQATGLVGVSGTAAFNAVSVGSGNISIGANKLLLSDSFEIYRASLNTFVLTQGSTGGAEVVIKTDGADYTNALFGVGVSTNPLEQIHSGKFVRADSGFKVGSNTIVDSLRNAFFEEGTFSADLTAEANLFVEGGLFAKEFTVDTTRVMLSSRFGSGGIVGEIVDATVGSEKIKFVDENGTAITPFADNDLMLIQRRSGVNSGTIVKSIKRKVVADSQPSNVVSLTTTGVTTGTDVGTIEVGDDAVLDGNTTNTARDSFIAVDVLDRDIAAFGFFDSQTDFGNGSEVMRVGGMEPGGANEYDSALTGRVGIAGKIGGSLAFALTEDEGLIGGANFDPNKMWSTNNSETVLGGGIFLDWTNEEWSLGDNIRDSASSTSVPDEIIVATTNNTTIQAIDAGATDGAGNYNTVTNIISYDGIPASTCLRFWIEFDIDNLNSRDWNVDISFQFFNNDTSVWETLKESQITPLEWGTVGGGGGNLNQSNWTQSGMTFTRTTDNDEYANTMYFYFYPNVLANFEPFDEIRVNAQFQAPNNDWDGDANIDATQARIYRSASWRNQRGLVVRGSDIQICEYTGYGEKAYLDLGEITKA